MVALPVIEDVTIPPDSHHKNKELVKFETQSTSDYYISKKFGQVNAGFATNTKTNNKPIRVNWATQPNGNVKITLTTNEVVTRGYLTIFGRK